MYKLCKTEQSAERQRALEQGLLEMMQTIPFDQISITDFCAKMQIPRKAFYRYFTDKDGALYALIDHTLMDYERFASAHQQGKRTLAGDIERYFMFWKEQKRLLDGLSRSNLLPALVERTIALTIDYGFMPSRFMEPKSIRLQAYALRFALSGMLSLMLRWYQSDFAESEADMAEIMVTLLTQPLIISADLA